MNHKLEERQSDERWFLLMKEIYLYLLKQTLEGIENGNEKDAEFYQQLEDFWTEVKQWKASGYKPPQKIQKDWVKNNPIEDIPF